MQKKVIGIDLGTTYSLASHVSEKGVEPVADENGTTFMPSAVAFVEGRTLVGEEALAVGAKLPERCFYSFKRFMGRSINDVDFSQERFPFKISAGPNDNIILGEDDFQTTPEQLSAHVLKRVKTLSETILNVEINQAVVTVPAYFDDVQRQATKDAAKIAGLEVLRMINEPTAAAVAYGLDDKSRGKLLVYDFGGGTFDVSILEMKDRLFKVIATKGDTKLGGDDLDRLVEQKICRDWLGGFDLKPEELQKLKKVSERIKIELTTSLRSEIGIDLPKRGISRRYAMKREEFEQLAAATVSRTIELVKEAMNDVGLKNDDIKEIVLVGGSSRVPLVREKLKKALAAPINARLDPDKVVSYGAGIQAQQLIGNDRRYLLLDVIPLSLGIETFGGVFSKLIVKNASIPAKTTETFSTSKDNQTGVEINIYQGERELVEHCRLLGKFKLAGIPPMPAGLPRVEVEFQIDQNGMLSVSARELRSETKASIEIIPQHGLTPSQVEKIIEDSLEFAEEDYRERHLIEFKAQAERMIAGLDKVWSQAEQWLSSERLDAIRIQKGLLLKAVDSDAPDEIKRESNKLGELTRDLADWVMSHAAKTGIREP